MSDDNTLTLSEAHLLRQWYNALQDRGAANDGYLTEEDNELYCKALHLIQQADPNYREVAKRLLNKALAAERKNNQSFVLTMPPSINRYYRSIGRGRVVISEDGRKYRKAVKDALLVQRVKYVSGRIGLELELCFTDKRACDLDNRLKSLQDALQKAGLFEDDSQIDLLIVRRGAVTKGGLVNVTIWKI